MAVVQAELDTLNTAIDSAHTALEVVIAGMVAGEELVYTELVTATAGSSRLKGQPSGGVRRIVLYEPTAGRPEAAGYDVNAFDSMRALIGQGDFSSSDVP